MKSLVKKHGNEAMLDIARQYEEQGGKLPYDLDALANFAMTSGLWNRGGDLRKQLCKRDFARAFREQYHTDPQGRHVRTFHASKTVLGEEQKVLWADVREPTTTSDYMHAAFQQRRSQIVGDCRQLKIDVDSFNENHSEGKVFQLVLNFTDDVAESEQPTTYRPKQPR
ncbi:MAG TPA: hypothetical protein VG826_11480 [Pirellulales bacterium]|nr:hypothetical protein [Pirellulales bacterium]